MIVAAAIKYPNGEVLTALRHYKIIHMQAQMGIPTKGDCEQGFIDHRGVFLTREEAKEVAIQCGQIDKNHDGTLYSEDIWPDTIAEAAD